MSGAVGRPRQTEPRARPANSKPCDGTAQDYRRHSLYGEEPCPASRQAWAEYHQFYTYTGVYPTAEDDPSQAKKKHPFFYRRPEGKSKRKRKGN